MPFTSFRQPLTGIFRRFIQIQTKRERRGARAYSIEDLENAVVTVRDGAPILVKNVAAVKAAPALKRSDGSFDMQPAVVATIQKQPNANTLEVTNRIEETLAALKSSLPPDVTINTKAFQQADFIKRAIGNVRKALIEGGIFTSTFLNMIVISALYLKYGKVAASIKKEESSRQPELALQSAGIYRHWRRPPPNEKES